MKNKIIDYITIKYDPHTLILYGSYADGSNNANSDFDALIITDKQCKFHDGTIIKGVKLDVFIYNTSHFIEDISCQNYIQIHDGEIIIDKYGMGKKLQNKVCEYIKSIPIKSKEEKEHLIDWCEKMYLRTKRDDTEGYFRWHWLLVDSLEIYFNINNEYYYGPKKSLKKLKVKDPQGYKYYSDALRKLDSNSLEVWLNHLKDILLKDI